MAGIVLAAAMAASCASAVEWFFSDSEHCSNGATWRRRRREERCRATNAERRCECKIRKVRVGRFFEQARRSGCCPSGWLAGSCGCCRKVAGPGLLDKTGVEVHVLSRGHGPLKTPHSPGAAQQLHVYHYAGRQRFTVRLTCTDDTPPRYAIPTITTATC